MMSGRCRPGSFQTCRSTSSLLKKGPVSTDSGLTFNAMHAHACASPVPDVMFVPSDRKQAFDSLADKAVLDNIARLRRKATWMTSVCARSRCRAALNLCDAIARLATGNGGWYRHLHLIACEKRTLDGGWAFPLKA